LGRRALGRGLGGGGRRRPASGLFAGQPLPLEPHPLELLDPPQLRLERRLLPLQLGDGLVLLGERRGQRGAGDLE
jgi:hypothetical protein